MPLTFSYDLRTDDVNHRTYIRSMLERFHWKRLGGSVFRYSGIDGVEDWLNHVAPSLMFFRSYTLAKGIEIRFLTLDASGISMLDRSDPQALFGNAVEDGTQLSLFDNPTNNQSSAKALREFVTTCCDSIP